ncbi:MAG TPA: VOC family protein [Blastococcus sp.]|nr:VOC family protein [Blastococcus sp.]
MSARMIFLNLPVQDLARARRFYEALGFRINEHSSDEGTVSVVVDENIVVTLLTSQRFSEFLVEGAGGPSTAPSVIPCLTAEHRAEVDDLVSRALDAGGHPWQPPREEGASYTASFADPDGSVWQVRWLDQLHVVN